MRSFVSSLWMMNLVLPTVSFGRVWCKDYLCMDLLTKHDDADNWDSVHLTIDNYTMFVLPMIHILPATYAKKLNEIPTHWTVRLSITTLLLNHVLDSDIWTICMIWRLYSLYESFDFEMSDCTVFWTEWLFVKIP